MSRSSLDDARGPKRAHSLHAARSLSELNPMLEAHGISLDHLLDERQVDPVRTGTLVVGSIAEGLGTPHSDVDLLVLVEHGADVLNHDSVRLHTMRSRESLTYTGGVEINIEVVQRPVLADALGAFLDVAPLLYDHRELVSIPILGPVELQLLHRVRTGWVARGAAVVDRWRDEFLVELLSIYLSVAHFVMANELLEDARALVDATDGSFSLAARAVAQEELLCLLAYAGCTNQQPKWVARLGERLLRQAWPVVLDRLLDLSFLPRKLDREQREEALLALVQLSQSVRATLAASPDLATAVRIVDAQLHYVD